MSAPIRRASLVESLADNALLAWSFKRGRGASLAFTLGWLAFLYGVTALMAAVILRPGLGGSMRDFLQGLHILTWCANAALFCLVVPLRLAQQIATERERRTLELLRMTAMPDTSLALGAVAAAYGLPLMLGAMSLPLALAGACSGRLAGPVEAGLAYVGLATSSLLYTMLAGVSAFAPKKATQASGGALLAVLGLAGVGALFAVPFAEPLGCLGPWGGFAGSFDREDRFVVTILGQRYPGLGLQVLVQLALAAVLFRVVARKLASDDAFLLGVEGGTFFAVVLALVAAVTLAERPALRPYSWNRATAEGLGARYVLLFFALLPVAVDSATPRELLIRGLARPPGERPHRDERRHPFLAPVAALVAAGLMSLGLWVSLGWVGVAPSSPFDPRALPVAAIALASYVAVAASAFQAARLLAPHTAPNTLAGAALLALWLVPLFTVKGLRELDIPLELSQLPEVVSPFPVIYRVAESAATTPSTSEIIAPLSLGLASVIVNGVIVAGLQVLIRRGEERAEELARSLVTLPADAFGVAPGGLQKTCPRGHVFEAKWDACPHCK